MVVVETVKVLVVAVAVLLMVHTLRKGYYDGRNSCQQLQWSMYLQVFVVGVVVVFVVGASNIVNILRIAVTVVGDFEC